MIREGLAGSPEGPSQVIFSAFPADDSACPSPSLPPSPGPHGGEELRDSSSSVAASCFEISSHKWRRSQRAKSEQIPCQPPLRALARLRHTGMAKGGGLRAPVGLPLDAPAWGPLRVSLQWAQARAHRDAGLAAPAFSPHTERRCSSSKHFAVVVLSPRLAVFCWGLGARPPSRGVRRGPKARNRDPTGHLSPQPSECIGLGVTKLLGVAVPGFPSSPTLSVPGDPQPASSRSCGHPGRDGPVGKRFTGRGAAADCSDEWNQLSSGGLRPSSSSWSRHL